MSEEKYDYVDLRYVTTINVVIFQYIFYCPVPIFYTGCELISVDTVYSGEQI